MASRYNAPWPLNLDGSNLYEDIETGEKNLFLQGTMADLTLRIATYCNCGEQI